jgi:hypothetical protein
MTLARTLGVTAHVSVLLRKARRLGVSTLRDAIAVAVQRGCRHYQAAAGSVSAADPGRLELPDDELVILLLLGEQPYDPFAIRCAAQLARSPEIDPGRLARLAVRERCERVLAHIAREGLDRDPDGQSHWATILEHIGPPPKRDEENLPHGTRFVSMPGFQRGGHAQPQWLTPTQER